jgi:hypothetical protein
MSRLSGQWRSHYSYQNSKKFLHAGEHIVVFEVENENTIGRSLPQKDGSELTLQLHYNEADCTLTGTWQEKTSPTGLYGGVVFYGAIQFIVNETGDSAKGKWVGFNSLRTQVKGGEWRLEKVKNIK